MLRYNRYKNIVMSNISFQVIPFAFILIIIIFFLSLKKSNKKNTVTSNELINNNYEEHKDFFENSEKKLLALKELYKQGLIDLDVYVKKSELVASSISRLTGKNIQDLIQIKKDNIYKQLKNDINKRAESISSKRNSGNLDKLISKVDERIQTGLNYDK